MEAVKLVEQQRKASEEIRESFATQNSFVIIPFQVSGIQDYTNAGYVNYQINPEDAETFKRVWTGNDSCVLSWYKSVSLNQYKSGNVVNYAYNYQVGDYILGEITSNDSDCELEQDVSYSEYTSQQIRKTISFRVDATNKTIGDYYQLMLYKIPTYSKDTVYRLSSISREYFNKQLLAYIITFTSINQDLAHTGKAKQQNINMSAPGQGYLNPMVMTANEFKAYQLQYPSLSSNYYKLLENGEYLVGDQTKLKNRPVTKMVVKLFGNGIPSTITCIGRPAGSTFSEYRYQRLLFPMNFTQPTTPTLYRTQLNNSNYYYGAFSPTLKYWKDFVTNIKDTFNGVNKWDYEGFFMYNYSKLQQTNPLNSNLYSYSLYYENGKNWDINNDFGTVSVWGTQGVYNQYNLGSNKAIHDRMWDAYWIQKNMVSLPLNVNSTLTYGNVLNAGAGSIGAGAFQGNHWLIGLGIGLFLIGALASWINKWSQTKPSPYYGIINAPLIDYTKDVFGSDSTSDAQNYPNKIPMNLFSDNTDNPSSLLFSSNTLNTSFEATLTDEFYITKNGKTQRFTTGNIGQKTFENGTTIPSDFLLNNSNSTDGNVLLVSGAETLVTPINSNGYIIDQIQINSAFKGDISIEFLDTNNEVVWSGIYQSQGKWNDSLREIWTLINTSVLNKENMYYTDQLPYPKALPEPTTEGLVIENITKNFSNTFEYSAIGNFNATENIYNYSGVACPGNPVHMFNNSGITISDAGKVNNGVNIIQNFSFTKDILLANWKTLELTFNIYATQQDGSEYLVSSIVKTFDITSIVNGTTTTFNINQNFTDGNVMSGKKYVSQVSVAAGLWYWEENPTNVSVSGVFNMNLNLNFKLEYSELNSAFVLTQTNANAGNITFNTIPAYYTKNSTSSSRYDMYCDFSGAGTNYSSRFCLSTAKLLLK